MDENEKINEEALAYANNGPQSRYQGLGNQFSRNSSAIALRQSSLQDRMHIEQERAKSNAMKMELQKVHQLAEIEKENLKIRDSFEKQRQFLHATKALVEIDPSQPDWEKKALEAQAAYPLGFQDKGIQEAMKFRHETAMRSAEAKQKLETYRSMLAASSHEALVKEELLRNSRAATSGAEAYEKEKGMRIAKAEADAQQVNQFKDTAEIEQHRAKISGDLEESTALSNSLNEQLKTATGQDKTNLIYQKSIHDAKIAGLTAQKAALDKVFSPNQTVNSPTPTPTPTPTVKTDNTTNQPQSLVDTYLKPKK